MTVFAKMQVVATMFLIVLTIRFPIPSSAENVYVTPSSDIPCPGEPCCTLSEYVQNNTDRLPSDTHLEFLFLPGDHVLDRNVTFENLTKLVLLGSSASFPVLASRVICSNQAEITFKSITLAEINSLSFHLCGINANGTSSFALIALFVEHFALVRVSLEDSIEHGVFVFQSNITITNSNFTGNRGGGLINSSTVTFDGNNYFHDNWFLDTSVLPIGAIVFVNSSISIRGTIRFFNNSAPYGGAIFAYNSSLIMTGVAICQGNTAGSGGAMYLNHSTLTSNGTVVYTQNIALFAGGAITALRTRISFSGANYFIYNRAIHRVGGAMNLINSTVNSTGPSLIQGNTAGITGGGLHATNYSTVELKGSVFMKNSALLGSGINAVLSTVVLDGINNFSNNIATIQSSCLQLTGGTLHINGHNSFTNNTGFQGVGIYVFRADVHIEGICIFRNNRAQFEGGALYAVSSSLTISGNVQFVHNSALSRGGASFLLNSSLTLDTKSIILYRNNSATEGGGILLEFESRIHFFPGSLMFLQSNIADNGAAIYVEDFVNPADCDTTLTTLLRSRCFYQVVGTSANPHLVFVSNVAKERGNVLYGGQLNRCLLDAKDPLQVENPNALETFQLVSTLISQNSSAPISSDPFDICLCDDGQPNCNIAFPLQHTVRGQTLTIPFVAIDQTRTPVPADIRTVVPIRSTSSVRLFLRETELIQRIEGECTDLNFTLNSPDDVGEVTLFAEGPCNGAGTSQHLLKVAFLPCPVGFELSFSECICLRKLQPYTNTCNVQDGRIERSGDFWISAVTVMEKNHSTDGLIIHPHCPLDYCRSNDAAIYVDPTNPDDQCVLGRSGALCGACRPDLSLALGNNHCLRCSNSNNYIMTPLLLFAFATAGITLVVFLLSFKLTVAVGTINGLIFYANIIALNKSIFFPLGNSNGLFIFIAWLNLDFGIETCFFNGMDAYVKTWLQFVFPLYVWTLIGILTVLSHYSSLVSRLIGRNPVAVLSTLFLMSYTKILSTVISALSFTFLDYPDGSNHVVWLYDGNVRYLQGKHAVLFVVSLLVLLVLFLPYTFVLLFGQLSFRSKRSRWIKPFLEAYHAPFEVKYRAWPGLLLLVRCVLFLIFAVNILGDPSVNLLAISSVTMGLMVMSRFFGQIYKNWYLDMWETSFILNLGILAAGTYHVQLAGGNQHALVHTSVGFTLLQFIGILIYHSWLQIKDSRLLKSILDERKEQQCHADDNNSAATANTTTVTGTIGYTTSHLQLREPLGLLEVSYNSKP